MKPRRAKSSQMGGYDMISTSRKQGGGPFKAVNVVWPTMQQQNGLTLWRSQLNISNVESAGIDLFDRTEHSAWSGRVGHWERKEGADDT